MSVIEQSLSTQIKAEAEASLEQMQTNIVGSLKTSLDGMMAAHTGELPTSETNLNQRARIDSLTDSVEGMRRQLLALLDNGEFASDS